MTNQNDTKKKFNKGGFKPILKTLKVTFATTDVKGNEYDTESAITLIKELEDAGCFKKLSVVVSVNKSDIGCEGKGKLSLGRIQSFDTEDKEMSFMIFTKNKEFADKINDKDFIIVPKILTGRDVKVNTILGFEIVIAAFTAK